MFRQKAEGLSVNNINSDEEYLRRYGFSSEDLSCLISPLATSSPIKKKQKSIFTFEEYDEQSDEENDVKFSPSKSNYDDLAISAADLSPTIDENALQKSFQEFALGSLNESDDNDDDGLLDQSSSTIVEFELISPTNCSKPNLETYTQTYKYSDNINLSLPNHQLGVPFTSTVFDPISYAKNDRITAENSMMDVILDDYFHPKALQGTDRQYHRQSFVTSSSSRADQHDTHHKYTPEVVVAAPTVRAMEPGTTVDATAGASLPAAKDDGTRSAKSLATISRKFVEFFGQARTIDYIGGLLPIDSMQDAPLTANRVDGTADSLGVHVRRIYELIKILETLSLVNVSADCDCSVP
jgi:hypothetical protein